MSALHNQSAVTVRTCRARDWRTLAALRTAMLESDGRAYDVDAADVAAQPEQYWQGWATSASAEVHCSIVFAEMDGAAIGMTAAHVDSDVDTVAHVGAVWVAPTTRGHGAARRMLAAVEQWAARRGVDRLELGVAEWNTAAIELYRTAGYEPTGQQIRTRWGHDELILAKVFGGATAAQQR